MAYLDGLGISAYRSFKQLERIGPFQKINIIIGQNNSGKSNVLKFITEQLPKVVQKLNKKKEAFDYPGLDRNRDSNGVVITALGLHLGGTQFNKLVEQYPIAPRQYHKYPTILESILRSGVLPIQNNVVWFDTTWDARAEYLNPELFKKKNWVNTVSPDDFQRLWTTMYPSQQGGGFEEHWAPQILYKVMPSSTLHAVKVYMIPAIRIIDSTISNDAKVPDAWDGKFIIDRLNRLQHPPLKNFSEYHSDKSKFTQINDFVKSVLEDDSAEIETSYDRNSILVSKDGKVLPLDHLGTGIHQLIILAIAATSIQDSIVCIEEPELYLHPSLQRKLINYLAEKTSNQYFITTHSAHILDNPHAAVFHITLDNGVSKASGSITPRQKSEICFDLGYKASDLMQSNCIVWVEGPSDRIYINSWIRHFTSINNTAPLREGAHYTIMFYGGSLLSHLTAKERNAELEEFKSELIELRKINRNMAILIDSDQSSDQDELRDVKTRLFSEFTEENCFVWITAGREIENYLPTESLKAAITKQHPTYAVKERMTKYTNNLICKNQAGKNVTADKIGIAHSLEKEIDFTIMDLGERMHDLVYYIKGCNHLNA